MSPKKVDDALRDDFVILGDLVLCEVMQGIDNPNHQREVAEIFSCLDSVNLGGIPIATKAAENFRLLRRKGITVRKTIDCIIATYCLEHNIPLLHNDKDFKPFQKHLGLIAAP